MTANNNGKQSRIEIIKPDMVFSNEYVKIYNDVVQFPAGNQGTYIRISSGTNKSVAVLPVTPDNTIVVLRNYRHGVRGWGVEIPKGAVEAGPYNGVTKQHDKLNLAILIWFT